MNIKIKADNVYALFDRNSKVSYDQVYAILKKQLSDEDFIFTKRTPGSGFLQWDLPGEGWMPLTQADPLVTSEVVAEKERRFRRIMEVFGSQHAIAQKVLSVPDDSYIFYRPSANGGIEVKITVWGYKYPEKVGGGGLTGKMPPKESTQEVAVSFIYDGKRLPAYDFRINGFARKTEADGLKILGKLPIGTSYEIETDNGHKVTITIVAGQRDYEIDVTNYVTVTVVVKKDGNPASETVCQLSYWGHSATLTTDAKGQATTTMPLDRSASDCMVNVEGENQRRPLTMPTTIFEFDLKTPEPEIPKEPISPEPPKEPNRPKDPEMPGEPKEPVVPDEPKEPETPKEPDAPEEPETPKPLRRFRPIIRIEGKEGFIGKRYPIRVTVGGESKDYVSDEAGEVHLPEYEEGLQMRVDDLLILDNHETYTLSADQLVYIFHVPYKPISSSPDIKIIVEDEDGHRMSGATIFFEQKDHPDTIGYLNDDGIFYIGFGDYATSVPLSVILTVMGEKWKPIVFELVEGENEYLLCAVRKASKWSRWLEILAAIGGLAATAATYCVVMAVLFG